MRELIISWDVTDKLNKNDCVLFLDFDGVLNSDLHIKRIRKGEPSAVREIDSGCVDLLNKIIEETNCKIVISSSWRMHNSLDMLIEILIKSGLKYPDNIIGNTLLCDLSHRGLEIQDWLFVNRFEGNYVILDDLDEYDFGLIKDHLIKTDFNFGLTYDIANEVIRKLKI